MESQEKFYKIYELKKIKNVCKYYFIGAFKHEDFARDFRLNTIDLDLIFNKNIATIIIKHGEISKSDIKDLEIKGVRTGDKESLEEIVRLVKKFKQETKENGIPTNLR